MARLSLSGGSREGSALRFHRKSATISGRYDVICVVTHAAAVNQDAEIGQQAGKPGPPEHWMAEGSCDAVDVASGLGLIVYVG